MLWVLQGMRSSSKANLISEAKLEEAQRLQEEGSEPAETTSTDFETPQLNEMLLGPQTDQNIGGSIQNDSSALPSSIASLNYEEPDDSSAEIVFANNHFDAIQPTIRPGGIVQPDNLGLREGAEERPFDARKIAYLPPIPVGDDAATFNQIFN